MLKPLGKRIVVRLKAAEQVSSGGLVLASKAKETPTTGEVVALGHLVSADDVVQIGDEVVFNEFAATKVTNEGVDYVVVDLDEVLAVLA